MSEEDASSSLNPVIRIPLVGEWVALPTPGHHPYAFDFAVVDGWRLNVAGWLRYLFSRVPAADFHAWDQPILAPFSGEVARVHDGEQDHDPINLIQGLRRVRESSLSNSVLIESDGAFALLVHFRRGSIQVSEGDVVEEGQHLGKVGNSGRSLFPHLHFQVMDDRNLARAHIVPFQVKQFESWDGKTWKSAQEKTLSKWRRYRFAA